MDRNRINEIINLMSLNYHYLTDEEKEVCEKTSKRLDYDELSSKDLETIKNFVPTLSERKAKSIGWADLDDDKIVFSTVGYKNLDQIMGMSSSEFINRKISHIPIEWVEGSNHRDGVRGVLFELEPIKKSLDFLDFYVRFANNSVVYEEFVKRIDDLANKVHDYSEKFEFHESYEYKDLILKEILTLLRSENKTDKVIGLEKFVNFSHHIEPSIIPHVFGCSQDTSGLLQSLIIYTLDVLSSPDRTELSGDNNEEKYFYERNSEHRRKIVKTINKKRIQEISRHIFRKNVSG